MATMTLDELVRQLQAAYGSGLRTVVLYGSAAAGAHIPKRSDQNVLVIVDAITMEQLRREGAVARAWMEAGNPPPLTMTEREWRASHDIFPIEYTDVLDQHRVLHGTAPFDGIAVDRTMLRLQVEHEAMGKLLRLRREVMAASGDARAEAEVLSASVTTIMVIFRAVVRLHGERADRDHEETCRHVARLAGIDPEPFLRALRHARGAAPLTGAAVGETLAGYLAGMEALVAHIDRLAHAG